MESETTRQQKVARQIQKDLAEIIRGRGMAAYDGALLTVSGVKITPDLALAKVYVSICNSASCPSWSSISTTRSTMWSTSMNC